MIGTIILLIFGLSTLEAKKPELPLCPSNLRFFPQNLPMHCRMPVTISPSSLEAIRLPPSGYPGPIPGAMPAPMPMPMPMPPMPPMPPSPAQKLPVIVMPLYSPDKPFTEPRPRRRKHKYSGSKRKPKHYYNSDDESTETDTSLDDTSRSNEHGWWRGSRSGRRSNDRHKRKRKMIQNRELLTPVLQYVTKDGYVIFEKQISKGEAKDWLVNKDNDNKNPPPSKFKSDLDSKELREDNDDVIKSAIKDNDNIIETKTEVNLHRKKKNIKRKPHTKHSAD